MVSFYYGGGKALVQLCWLLILKYYSLYKAPIPNLEWVLAREQVDDLEGVLDNPHGHQLLACTDKDVPVKNALKYLLIH